MKKIKMTDLTGLKKVESVLYACGKDMAKNRDLHQWDNTHTKNMLILALCELKNDVFLVSDEAGNPVATFQVNRKKDSVYFEKIATLPEYRGQGIAGKMLEEIKKVARERGCSKITCSVYEKNTYARTYYLKKGFGICGTTQTKKYQLIDMELEIV